MTIVEEHLQKLREEYKFATPERKAQILRSVKQIKKSVHLYRPVVLTMKDFRKPSSDEVFVENVKTGLF